jgi:chromosome segregation ATPase
LHYSDAAAPRSFVRFWPTPCCHILLLVPTPHTQRVAGVEASKAELEQQLAAMAALVAQLEARLRDVTTASEAASMAAELAAAQAAAAQAAVGEQVAARLAAAGHNRSLWPPAARQEVEQLEQQLEMAQVRVCLMNLL